jgi:hypothetical protein
MWAGQPAASALFLASAVEFQATAAEWVAVAERFQEAVMDFQGSQARLLAEMECLASAGQFREVVDYRVVEVEVPAAVVMAARVAAVVITVAAAVPAATVPGQGSKSKWLRQGSGRKFSILNGLFSQSLFELKPGN